MNEDYKEREKKEIDNNFNDQLMSAILDYETIFLKSEKELKIKSVEYWGMLSLANKLGIIDWERVIYLFGEFISKAMNLH